MAPVTHRPNVLSTVLSVILLTHMTVDQPGTDNIINEVGRVSLLLSLSLFSFKPKIRHPTPWMASNSFYSRFSLMKLNQVGIDLKSI